MLLSRDLAPRIRIRDRALHEGPHDIGDEDQLAESQDERPDRLEPVQGPHGWRVVVDTTRHALEAEEVHREEDEVHPDEREGEVPPRQSLGVHATGHPREPEVEAREYPEDRAAEQDVMEVGDDPV